MIRPLGNGHYELEVLNTSGIGTINRFTWTSPQAWTITSITKTSGASCNLASERTMVCMGEIAAPACLCSNSGGTVTIEFAVKVQTPKAGRGAAVSYGVEGAHLRIKAMTAVPFLIPGTPQQAKREHGV